MMTVIELLDRAKQAIESGENSLAGAAAAAMATT